MLMMMLVLKVGKFYLALDKLLDLNVGKIVLAASSSSQLRAILDQDLPYLDPFVQETEACINGSDKCQSVVDLFKSLGIDCHSFIPKFILRAQFLQIQRHKE